jgi:sodium/proline symporter
MFAALLLVPVMAMQEMGGWQASVQRIGALDPARLDVFSGLTGLSLVSLMAWGLGYFGQPHILARFMAMRSSGDAPKARLIATAWMILALYGAVFTGFAAAGHAATAPLDNPETAFIALTQALFNPWIAGCLLAAVLAAIMSTVDSQLLVCSAALTQDLYRPFLRQQAGEGELVWVGRSAVAAIAVVALALAWDPQSRVLDLVAYAWAGFGAGFGPAVVLSVLWRRTTRNGTLAGMIAGAATVVLWANLEGEVFDLYEILPGFIAGLAVNVMVSLLGKPLPEVLAEFDRV